MVFHAAVASIGLGPHIWRFAHTEGHPDRLPEFPVASEPGPRAPAAPGQQAPHAPQAPQAPAPAGAPGAAPGRSRKMCPPHSLILG